MNVPAGFAVGCASHTGAVRVANEDDYLLGAVQQPGGAGAVMLCAIADGMGGAAGGAEASRAALRALGAAVLDGESDQPVEARLRDGFARAGARVFEEASAVPALRDMGTTLTALCLLPGRAWFGHIGDTRLYRIRGGSVTVLTEDHAVREPDNLLLRCIGGGQATCAPDVGEVQTEQGDRLLLLSDGIWSVVGGADLLRSARTGSVQAAADALVALALAAGGPDNATAVVVEVLAPAPGPAVDQVDLPREERAGGMSSWPRPVALRAPFWPWLVLAAAALLAGHAFVRWWFGVDGWVWLWSMR